MSWVIQWELTLAPLFRDLLPLALSFKTTATFNYDVSAERVQSCDLVSREQDGRNCPLAELGKSWKMDFCLFCGKSIIKGLKILHFPLGIWNLSSQALPFSSYPPMGGHALCNIQKHISKDVCVYMYVCMHAYTYIYINCNCLFQKSKLKFIYIAVIIIISLSPVLQSVLISSYQQSCEWVAE